MGSDAPELREAGIERLFVQAVEAVDGKAFKFVSPGNAGVPDRIVLLGGKAYFVELKAPGRKPRALQRYRERQFRRLGFTIHVIDDAEAVRGFIDAIREQGGDPFHV